MLFWARPSGKPKITIIASSRIHFKSSPPQANQADRPLIGVRFYYFNKQTARRRRTRPFWAAAPQDKRPIGRYLTRKKNYHGRMWCGSLFFHGEILFTAAILVYLPKKILSFNSNSSIKTLFFTQIYVKM